MLKLDGITKIFSKNTINEKKAIDNISLEIEKGEFVTVVGSNGAGKSTMLNAIAGVFSIDQGSIFLDDADFTNMKEYKRARHIGRVFQDPLMGTAQGMTIEQNLSMAYNKNRGFGLQKGITKKDRDYFREQLGILDMGLEDRMTEKAMLLSGGQRQALTLFMAALSKPSLLLLDEHTAALDPKAASKVLNLTKYYSDNLDLSILMITHNMEDALKYGNRTLLMKDGKIVMDVKGEERKNLTVETLINKFEIANDRILLK